MTIKEAEEQTGLKRSNIRFYEKEKLIEPTRNAKNGYREYSNQDIERIKKIAYLRTLEISIEDIRSIITGKASFIEIIEKQDKTLQTKMEDLHYAKNMCRKMLKDKITSFDAFQVEKYTEDFETYRNGNPNIFKPDSVSFLHIWGSLITWSILALLCLTAGILSYPNLPAKIPIQWSGAAASAFADKNFIFLYPILCILIRVFVKPVIYIKFFIRHLYGELITEYLSNYICFTALSIELFTILSAHGLIQSIVPVLLADTAVLIGILAAGIHKMIPGSKITCK